MVKPQNQCQNKIINSKNHSIKYYFIMDKESNLGNWFKTDYNHCYQNLYSSQNFNPENIKKIKKNIKENIFKCDYYKNRIDDLETLKPLTKEIVETAYTYLNENEFQYNLREKNHLYPYDMLILIDAINEGYNEKFFLSTISTFYYLHLHLLDDLYDSKDDYEKNFKNSSPGKNELFDIFIDSLERYLSNSEQIGEKTQKKLLINYKKRIDLTENLYKEYFLNGNDKFNSDWLVKTKADEVSGTMYSFLGDIIINYRNLKKRDELIKGLRNLGSMCQLTDDYRDYLEDLENKEPNILVSLINESSEYNEGEIIERWRRLFKTRCEASTKHFSSYFSNNINKEDVKLIAIYPFFKNSLL